VKKTELQIRINEFYSDHPYVIFIELVIALLIIVGNIFGFIPLTSTIYLVLFAWLILFIRGKKWRDFGLSKPASWSKTIILSLLIGIVYQTFSLYLIEPFLSTLTGELPDVSIFQSMVGDLPSLLFWILMSWTLAAFGEELVYRGYFMHRISDIFKNERAGVIIAVILSSILFGSGHLYQGLSGMISVAMFGLMFALSYYLSGRNLWAPILAHGITDTAGFIMIYFGVYPAV
jgi:membrane protease YdiL (CAAX protease family)